MPITKASLQLDAVMCSPQGQRVTRAQPFQLRSELRPKSCVLSREDLDLIEAREKAFRCVACGGLGIWALRKWIRTLA